MKERKKNSILILKWAVVIFFTLTYISCMNNSPLKRFGKIFETIMVADSGMVHGIKLNDTYEKVRSIDVKNWQDIDVDKFGRVFDDSTLYYEFSLGSEKNYYSIVYHFSDKKLDGIEMDVYMETEPEAGELFNSFQTYFDEKYGQSFTEGDNIVWSEGKENRIIAADESPTYKKGKLTIIFQRSDL